MSTVSIEIDRIQARLFDDEKLWTREELLAWYNDAYGDLLARSCATRRLWIEDVPGRVAYAHSQEWESAEVRGTAWKYTGAIGDATRQGTSNWEAEFIEGVSPAESRAGIAQPWERAYSGDSDQSFRFALPKEHDKTQRVVWDDRILIPVVVKELDTLRTWTREPGQPIVWTAGTGRNRSFELYEIRTDYHQGYEHTGTQHGGIRQISGSRTYAYSTVTPIANTWAYSSRGDSDAFYRMRVHFVPTSAVTSDAEMEHGIGDEPYRFTLKASTDSWDLQGLGAGYYGTQPWEIGNRDSGTTRGMHVWENLHGAVIPQMADNPPALPGFGIRFTQEATPASLGYATQEWEEEQLEGSTPSTVGVLLGLFSWEALHGATVAGPKTGTLRQGFSGDRQYHGIPDAMTGAFVGLSRRYRSSELAVMVTEMYLPDQELQEEDNVPELLPRQLLKYLRYYVWSRAYGRQGDGYRPELAEHYRGRFDLGARFLNRLLDLAQKDRDWTRAPVAELAQRPLRVQFPAQFPRVMA